MSRLPLLIEPEHLEGEVSEPDVLVVDLRPLDRYRPAHIRNAVQLDYEQIVAARPPVGGLLPAAEQLSAVLGSIGLTADHHVVAYDDEGGGRAARLLWTLDALGHPASSLLNGGLIAWQAENRPLTGDAADIKASDYNASLANPAVVAERDYIVSRLGDEDFVTLDSRTMAEYNGLDKRAARGGHIPGAVNMNWTDAVDRQRGMRLRPEAKLRGLLESLGATGEKEVVTYCQTHHRSSHTYFVLKYLGYQRIRGYHGAWSDWGNDPDTPIEV